jgi:hypothetical protein
VRDPASAAEVAAALAAEMAAALADIHGAGLLHRDLKPENFLLPPGIGNRGAAVKLLAARIASIRERRDQVTEAAFALSSFGGFPDLGDEALFVLNFRHWLACALRGRRDRRPDAFTLPATSSIFPLDKYPANRIRPREMTVGALLTQLRANPFSLFAVRVSRSPGRLPRGATYARIWDLGRRKELLRFLNAILAAFSLALILLLAALAHRPAVLALTLLLVAVARCFGRRSEADVVLAAAHQSLSAVAGRRPERR